MKAKTIIVVTIVQCIQTLNHYVVHLKLIEYWRSIMPQIKKKKRPKTIKSLEENMTFDLAKIS